jgi:hypothetical protein
LLIEARFVANEPRIERDGHSFEGAPVRMLGYGSTDDLVNAQQQHLRLLLSALLYPIYLLFPRLDA